MKKRNVYGFWNRLLVWLGWWEFGSLENSFYPRGFKLQRGQRSTIKRSYPHSSMRKWVGMGVFILASAVAGPLMAQEIASDQRWIEQLDGGLVFPEGGSVVKNYNSGYGWDLGVGYRLSHDFSLMMTLGYYDCDQVVLGGAAGEWIYMPLLATARYSFGSGTVKPYVMFGFGAAFNNYSLTVNIPGGGNQKLTRDEPDLLLSPGLGVRFIVAGDMAVFFQGRVDINFANQTIAGGPPADNPTLFIPVQCGISFFAR